MQTPKDIERLLMEQVVDDLLAAGYLVSVNDGEETTVTESTDRAEILDAMRSTDEDYLLARLPGVKRNSWVRLIYGNGADLISDFNVSLEGVLANANALAERLQKEEAA